LSLNGRERGAEITKYKVKTNAYIIKKNVVIEARK